MSSTSAAAVSRITQTFDRLRSAGKMAFMPFITAGDPDLAATEQLLERLTAAGVDLIEIGFPYSDPIADGPVIQSSYNRALQQGVQVSAILKMISDLSRRRADLPPLVGMIAYAIVFRVGTEKFLSQAKAAGLSGLIIPDLPADEASEMAAATKAAGLDLIPLIAPTTTQDRAKRILASAQGFLYCISVAGITGMRQELPPELSQQLRWLKSQSDLPLAVGFGVSRPEQVPPLRGLADGVIVGSALVRFLEPVSTAADRPQALQTALQGVDQLARTMVEATHQTA